VARTPDPLLVVATSVAPLPPGRPGPDVSTAPDPGVQGAGVEGAGVEGAGEGRPPEAFLELWRAAGADAVAAAGAERMFLNLRVQAGRELPHPLRHPRLPWRHGTEPGPPPVTDEPVQVTVPRPPFRRTRAFRVLAAGTVAALLLAGYGTAYAVQRAGGCQPAGLFSPAAVVRNAVGDPALGTEYAPDGECIGLTDAAGHLPGTTREVNGMLAGIAGENAKVARLQRSRTPPGYVTVVVLTTLTSPTSAGKSIAAGLNELRGAWLAQRAVNTQADDGSNLPMRLVVANGGGNSAYADRTSRRIVRLAKHDPTVVAVTGLGQSREATRRAIALLGAAGIPMVGSTNSADVLADTPYYFRVAANNLREARVALAYADTAWHPRNAVILADPGDTYSMNLATDFAGAFAPRPATTLTYHAQSRGVAGEMLAAVRRICRDRPDLIYYAGRANEFSLLGFLNHPGPDGCPDYAAHIVGDDDLENLGTPPRADFTLGQSSALLFTAWATPDPRLPGGVAHPGSGFYADYAARFGGSWPAAHAVLAHDATALIGDMVRERYLPYVRPHVSRADVYRKLRGLTPTAQWRAGASGLIGFDHGTPVDKTVVMVAIEPAGQPRAIGICGGLTPALPQSPFCPAET
jgi:ABC-type branched-subunit amino acid transport system substrate-binding protein